MRNLLDITCIAYLDDILIYSDDKLEHKVHVKQVVDALRTQQLLLIPADDTTDEQVVKKIWLQIQLTPGVGNKDDMFSRAAKFMFTNKQLEIAKQLYQQSILREQEEERQRKAQKGWF